MLAITVLPDIDGLAARLNPWAVATFSIIALGLAFAFLLRERERPNLPRPDRLPPPLMPCPTYRSLTPNEKARAIFADRSWGCHVTVTAGGATSRAQLAYSRLCLEDVALILGEDAAQILGARHRDLFGPDPSPSDDGMERLSNDLWRLSGIAWAQRSPFSAKALIEIDRRSPGGK